MKKRNNALGLVRVGTAVPRIKVADPTHNAAAIVNLMGRADTKKIDVLVFPELSLTGYTCGDLFHQKSLQEGALDGLETVRSASVNIRTVVVVGLPVALEDKLANCAAVIHRGKILGIVPKSFIPGYKEFYEPRWFSPAAAFKARFVNINGEEIPFGRDLLFFAEDFPGLVFGVEICEDVWVPIPPSVLQALAGSVLGLNLSASNERIGKADYRRMLIPAHSARIMSAYAYASCGTSESTTDVVFSGHCLITENGATLEENARFEREEVLQYTDIDIERLQYDRLICNSWAESQREFEPLLNFRRIGFTLGKLEAPKKLARKVEAHPFVPSGKLQLRARCEEIFNIQVHALCKRLETWGMKEMTIGVSGGLDSTLALIAACKVVDTLGMPRTSIKGYTMPGYGTTSRTKNNAHALMKHLGITAIEVDIRAMCFEQWRSEKYKPFGIDLEEVVTTVKRRYLETIKGRELKAGDLDVDFTALAVEEFCERLRDLPDGAQDLRFENTQARMRTKILMDNGFVVGTGDVSELALGWCTYNGDHMSMYNVNCSVPKTLVKFLCQWAAENQFDGDARATLLDICNTVISPELLPANRKGENKQDTEKSVGPYELNDFYLYHMLRFGFSPEKILYLARQAKFNGTYSDRELWYWLRTFYVRFFKAQFKRSCVPDGPKVGSISLSPRGDWRMPSDASVAIWTEWLDRHKDQFKEKTMRAHVIVDAINAFASESFGGELPVPEGELVGPEIGKLQDSGIHKVTVAGNDCHPHDMFNFKEVAGDVPTIKDGNGADAPVFPRHAVVNTWGAEFLPGVKADKIDRVFLKGDKPNLDSFSACGNADLVPYLKAAGITDVDVTGLVFRICVGSTAIDLAKAGFKVRVIVDATRDLDIPAFQGVIDEMKTLGVEIITVAEAIARG